MAKLSDMNRDKNAAARAEVEAELAVGTSAKREAMFESGKRFDESYDKAAKALSDGSGNTNPSQRFIREMVSDVRGIGTSLAAELGYDFPDDTKEFRTSTNAALSAIFDEIAAPGNTRSPLEVFQAGINKFDLPDPIKATLSERANVRMAGILAGEDVDTLNNRLPKYPGMSDAEFESRYISRKLFPDDAPTSAPVPTPAPAPVTPASFLDEPGIPEKVTIDYGYDDFIEEINNQPQPTRLIQGPPTPEELLPPTDKANKPLLSSLGKPAENVSASTSSRTKAQAAPTPASAPAPPAQAVAAEAAPAPDPGAPSRTITSGTQGGSAQVGGAAPPKAAAASQNAGPQTARTVTSTGAPTKGTKNLMDDGLEAAKKVAQGGNLKLVGLGALLGLGAYGVSRSRRTQQDNIDRRLEMQRRGVIS